MQSNCRIAPEGSSVELPDVLRNIGISSSVGGERPHSAQQKHEPLSNLKGHLPASNAPVESVAYFAPSF